MPEDGLSDNSVTLENINLDEILQIVRELRKADVRFTWEYVPKAFDSPDSVKKSIFTFEDERYVLWFTLRYK